MLILNYASLKKRCIFCKLRDAFSAKAETDAKVQRWCLLCIPNAHSEKPYQLNPCSSTSFCISETTYCAALNLPLWEEHILGKSLKS